MRRLRLCRGIAVHGALVAAGALLACGAGEGGDAPRSPPAPAPGPMVLFRVTGEEVKPPTLAFRTPPKPEKGASVLDPLFHQRVTRASDRAIDGYKSPGLVNEYARHDPENADGTRALLRGTEGDWWMYSLPGLVRLGEEMGFRGNPDAEPRWHPTDPAVVFFVEGPSLWRMNVETREVALVHDFSTLVPSCRFVRCLYEGEPSQDARWWCLRLDDEGYRPLRVVCYDREGDLVSAQLTEWGTELDWVGVSMTGTHCVLGSGDERRAVAYHRDFTHPVTLPEGVGHADVALDADGRDVLVYQNARTDWIEMCDLETGKATPLVHIPFGDNPDIGLHLSGNAAATPGWVLVSTYGESPTASSWMDQSLFLLQLRASPVVWRVCQTYQVRDPSMEKDYFGEAFAAINRAGTRVWWGSSWRATGAPNHRYEAYFASLPAGWPAAAAAAP